MSSNLLKAALVAAVVLPAGNAIAQGLAPMVGASAIQGTLQAAAGSGSSPGPSSAPLSSTQNTASGASSGASVNGHAIPFCSHGGLCQGAVMRAIGRPRSSGRANPGVPGVPLKRKAQNNPGVLSCELGTRCSSGALNLSRCLSQAANSAAKASSATRPMPKDIPGRLDRERR